MRKKQYERVIGCMGVAVLCGMLHHPGTAAAEGLPMRTGLWPEHAMLLQDTGVSAKGLWKQFGAEYQYIEGLEWLSELVLTELPKEKAEVQEEATEAVTDSAGEEESIEQAEGELTLMQRVNTLEGTRVFANVSNFVNVRQAADTKSSVVGKLYGKCVATVLQEEGDWVYVTSGNVTGYVVKEFLLLGEEAEAAIAKTYQPKIKVTANTLNVRAGAGTEYETLGSFKKGAEAELLEKGSEWMKIRYVSGNESRTGYVFAKYVEITGEPKYGETLKEEAKRLEEEKKAKEKEEAEKKAKKEKEEASKKAAAEQAKRDKAKEVADYAKTAVGTAYVWGGTNLKTGVDCSGLCYAAYKAYGYTLPRVSRDMAASSAFLSVTANSTYLKPGDLVFYASGGRVDHVAMYIGDGKVVHASDYNTGVIISRYNYRTPHSAKRVIY